MSRIDNRVPYCPPFSREAPKSFRSCEPSVRYRRQLVLAELWSSCTIVPKKHISVNSGELFPAPVQLGKSLPSQGDAGVISSAPRTSSRLGSRSNPGDGRWFAVKRAQQNSRPGFPGRLLIRSVQNSSQKSGVIDRFSRFDDFTIFEDFPDPKSVGAQRPTKIPKRSAFARSSPRLKNQIMMLRAIEANEAA